MFRRHAGCCSAPSTQTVPEISAVPDLSPRGCLLALKWQSHKNIIAGRIRGKKNPRGFKNRPALASCFSSLYGSSRSSSVASQLEMPEKTFRVSPKTKELVSLLFPCERLKRATLNRGLGGTLSPTFPQAFVGCRARSWRKPAPRYLKTAWEFSCFLGWGCFACVCVCEIRYRRESRSQQQKM